MALDGWLLCLTARTFYGIRNRCRNLCTSQMLHVRAWISQDQLTNKKSCKSTAESRETTASQEEFSTLILPWLLYLKKFYPVIILVYSFFHVNEAKSWLIVISSWFSYHVNIHCQGVLIACWDLMYCRSWRYCKCAEISWVRTGRKSSACPLRTDILAYFCYVILIVSGSLFCQELLCMTYFFYIRISILSKISRW